MTIEEKTKAKAREIAEKHGVNYEVEKRPLQDQFGNKTPFHGVYNPKHELFMNSVTDAFTLVQNEDILTTIIGAIQQFGELDPDQGDVLELHEGRKILFEIPIMDGNNILQDGDQVSQKIAILDGKDGSNCLKASIGTEVRSCKNGLYHVKKGWDLRAKHTASIEEKMGELGELIPELLKESYALKEKYEAFQSTKASRDLLMGLERELMGYDMKEAEEAYEKGEISGRRYNLIDGLDTSMNEEIAQKGMNVWGLLNGVTYWTSHRKKAPNRENGRIESLVSGTNAKVNAKAFSYLEGAVE